MARLLRWAFAGSLLLAGCGGDTSSPPSEPPPASAGTDPADDAFMESGDVAPGYLDLVRGEVTTGADGTLSFVQTLAEQIPEDPPLPAADAALGWSSCLDTDPSSTPTGFPFATISAPCEFIVHTRWDGNRLSGLLIDRRPLEDGRSARKVPIEPVLEGAAIRTTVPTASLGEPTTFAWSMFAEELGPFGTDIFFHVDSAPDDGVDDPIIWSNS